MAITFRHDAAAVVPPSNQSTRKYGQQLVMQQQQQKYAAQQQGYNRLLQVGMGQQQQQYDEAARQQNFMESARKQSTGMIMDDIKNGNYDPVTANKLRQNLVDEAEALSNPHLDATQRADVLQKYRAARALHTANRLEKPAVPNRDDELKAFLGPNYDKHKDQPWVPDPKGGFSIADVPQPPPKSAEDAFKADPRLQKKYEDDARALEIGDGELTPENRRRIGPRARQLWEEDNLPAKPHQGIQQVPSGIQPVGNFSGGQGAVSQDIALAPAHPDYKAPPTPTDRRDAQGYVIMSDGSKVDPRDSAAMKSGGQQVQSVARFTNPDGSQIDASPSGFINELSTGSGQFPPPPPPPQNAWSEIQAMNAIGQRNNPEALRRDVASGNYVNSPEVQAQLEAEAQGRYLQDQGPSMGRYTGVMNNQADAMSENLAGSQGRINNPVPYGARNAYSPLGGERELADQQRMTSGVPSQEELLASNKRQVDGMRQTQATNNAAMQDRQNYQIQDPKQMRIDMQKTTDAYNIYKRKGGSMDFRKWANTYNETNGMTPDVKAQFAHNYPGIWEGKDGQMPQKIDPASTDINQVAGNSGKKEWREKRFAALNAIRGAYGQTQFAPRQQTAPTAAPVLAGAQPREEERSILEQSPEAPQAGSSKYGRFGAAPPTVCLPPTRDTTSRSASTATSSGTNGFQYQSSREGTNIPRSASQSDRA